MATVAEMIAWGLVPDESQIVAGQPAGGIYSGGPDITTPTPSNITISPEDLASYQEQMAARAAPSSATKSALIPPPVRMPQNVYNPFRTPVRTPQTPVVVPQTPVRTPQTPSKPVPSEALLKSLKQMVAAGGDFISGTFGSSSESGTKEIQSSEMGYRGQESGGPNETVSDEDLEYALSGGDPDITPEDPEPSTEDLPWLALLAQNMRQSNLSVEDQERLMITQSNLDRARDQLRITAQKTADKEIQKTLREFSESETKLDRELTTKQAKLDRELTTKQAELDRELARIQITGRIKAIAPDGTNVFFETLDQKRLNEEIRRLDEEIQKNLEEGIDRRREIRLREAQLIGRTLTGDKTLEALALEYQKELADFDKIVKTAQLTGFIGEDTGGIYSGGPDYGLSRLSGMNKTLDRLRFDLEAELSRAALLGQTKEGQETLDKQRLEFDKQRLKLEEAMLTGEISGKEGEEAKKTLDKQRFDLEAELSRATLFGQADYGLSRGIYSGGPEDDEVVRETLDKQRLDLEAAIRRAELTGEISGQGPLGAQIEPAKTLDRLALEAQMTGTYGEFDTLAKKQFELDSELRKAQLYGVNEADMQTLAQKQFELDSELQRAGLTGFTSGGARTFEGQKLDLASALERAQLSEERRQFNTLNPTLGGDFISRAFGTGQQSGQVRTPTSGGPGTIFSQAAQSQAPKKFRAPNAKTFQQADPNQQALIANIINRGAADRPAWWNQRRLGIGKADAFPRIPVALQR